MDKTNNQDWVAENVMGFERKRCQGTEGGGQIDTDGTFEIWTWCDWCEKRVESGEAGPCPCYPFPKFTWIDLVRKLSARCEEHELREIHFGALQKAFDSIGADGIIHGIRDPLEILCEDIVERYRQRDRA